MPGIAQSSQLLRSRFYWLIATLIAVWIVGMVALAAWVPDLYFYSYYSVDYTLGFVRRGLAGELLRLLPGSDYFTALRVLRWTPTIAFGLALTALAWTIWNKFGRSERRLMMALLVPVLPFGVVFALFSARPDLMGGAALVCLAIFLAARRTDRAVLTACTLYGSVNVPLTLVHEATPFLFGLGATAAVFSLAGHCTPSVRRISAVVAIAPGVATGLAVALFGLRGVSDELCALVPSWQVNNPLAGRPTMGQLLRGFQYSVDYHDWLCQFILPYFDQGFLDATRFIAGRGAAPLTASVLLGILVFFLTMLLISHVSSVTLGAFWIHLKAHILWIAAGLALFLPVFLTGVDWTRWWVIISLDIGVAYMLFASSRQESALAPTSRTRRTFAAGVAVFALIPVGIVPGFAGVIPW